MTEKFRWCHISGWEAFWSVDRWWFCSMQFHVESLSLPVKSIKPDMMMLSAPPGSALSPRSTAPPSGLESNFFCASVWNNVKVRNILGWLQSMFLPPETGWLKSNNQIHFIWSHRGVSFRPVWMFILNNIWEMCENMQLDAASKRDLSIVSFFFPKVPSHLLPLRVLVKKCSRCVALLHYLRIYFSCHSGTFSPPSARLNAHSCAFSLAWQSIFGAAAAHNGMPTVGEVFAECSKVLHIHQTPLVTEGDVFKASPQISQLKMGAN